MKTRIKIIHITSSLKVGGAEAVLCDIIRKLGDAEFDHHVIYFHGGPNVESVNNLGAKTYKVSGLMFLYDPFFVIRLFFLIKRLGPDVIHSLLWSANILTRCIAWILKIPNVSVYHLDICRDSIFRKIIDGVTRGLADSVIAVSDVVANSLNDKRTKVIKNGIDFDNIYSKVENNIISRESLGLLADDFVIGSVGRMHRQKNFPLLLKSFSLVNIAVKNVKLVIVGCGQQEYFLRDLVDKLGIKNKVVFVVGKKAYSYYPIFNCFVQSSYNEGLSIALLEAMSFSLPCIATRGNNNHPVIQHGKNGFLVSSGDDKAIAKYIQLLINDSLLASKIGNLSKQVVVDEFSVDCMIGRYKKIFCGLSNREL